MAQLIQLKSKLKTVATIKKITHVMRLVAISSHTKLKKQTVFLNTFKNEISPLLCLLYSYLEKKEEISDKKKPLLYILVASDKGLCGSFNTMLYAMFDAHLKDKECEILCIGKKAVDYAHKNNIVPIKTFTKITVNTITKQIHSIYETVLHAYELYENIIFLHAEPKTFFLQTTHATRIVPAHFATSCETQNFLPLDTYIWLQDKEMIAKKLMYLFLKIQIHVILTQSMLAEQSARFLSMEKATNNAEDMIKNIQILYNKIRQTKITNELMTILTTNG